MYSTLPASFALQHRVAPPRKAYSLTRRLSSHSAHSPISPFQTGFYRLPYLIFWFSSVPYVLNSSWSRNGAISPRGGDTTSSHYSVFRYAFALVTGFRYDVQKPLLLMSIRSRNSFFVCTCGSSSYWFDKLICLFILLFYHSLFQSESGLFTNRS